MNQIPYDYSTRKGIRPISWDDFHGLCKTLAAAVGPWRPEAILAVGRGGFYPGTLLSHLLQAEIYPVRLTRRVNDVVVRERPEWLLEPPALVAGKRVLIVDEISSTGETLDMVRERVLALRAADVRCAVLYAHTWGADAADYIGLISDELLLNPWDREVWRDGAFVFHPEYVGALAEQGLQPDASLLVSATPFTLAKRPAP
jgi:hypoxanthine phosphoribosyltransferase